MCRHYNNQNDSSARIQQPNTGKINLMKYWIFLPCFATRCNLLGGTQEKDRSSDQPKAVKKCFLDLLSGYTIRSQIIIYVSVMLVLLCLLI